ncbi:hypothetical protein [Natronobeatus ordinarius]|uniref:hypothetical protein n=1 Tax=Natronobeatus ordinarius TaxID=2963433 RepID=UPI0020CC06C2|nr:hypothetical protein [Natronobeatus ordinarius]
MGLLESIRSAFEPADTATETIVGAHWCDDCSVRTPVYDERSTDGERPPCPDCGDPMRFERSPDSGSCAC